MHILAFCDSTRPATPKIASANQMAAIASDQLRSTCDGPFLGHSRLLVTPCHLPVLEATATKQVTEVHVPSIIDEFVVHLLSDLETCSCRPSNTRAVRFCLLAAPKAPLKSTLTTVNRQGSQSCFRRPSALLAEAHSPLAQESILSTTR